MLKTYAARGTDSPWYQGRDITDDERAVFRATTIASQNAKRRALDGDCTLPKHPVNLPQLDPLSLMTQKRSNGLHSLSLFSGGGGMDIGFDRAGFVHAASYELMPEAASVIRTARPEWKVFGGNDGDVRQVDWSPYRDKVDVLHGGPPCQPFSHAGRQLGSQDARDMIPEFVRAVISVSPRAFVCENVSGLAAKQFRDYVLSTIIEPLRSEYSISQFTLNAADFGVPQKRKRIFFVGFLSKTDASRFKEPKKTHRQDDSGDFLEDLPKTMGVRKALGLPEIGIDSLAPTLRSGLTGPRHTTSILSSATALKLWNKLEVWPNGVAADREHASGYVVKNGHFRLSVPDCLVLQGFPASWPVRRPVYFALGMIGNSVAPPMAYHLALSIAKVLKRPKSAQMHEVATHDPF